MTIKEDVVATTRIKPVQSPQRSPRPDTLTVKMGNDLSVPASGQLPEGIETLSRKLSFVEKVGYGLGDTASNFYWQTFLNFLAYFYTDVFGLAAGAAGTMFLAVRIPDACFTPLIGVIADRTETRWGHYRPYLLWGCLPIAFLGMAMFTTPHLGPWGKLLYAYATYCLILLAYTFINIPYSALMGVISPNSLERTSASSYRFVLAYGGLFMVQGLTIPMVKGFGRGNDQRGFQMAMVVYGLLAIGFFVTTFFTTHERVQSTRRPGDALKDDLRDLLKNIPWIMANVIGIFAVFYVALRMGAILYYFKYCVVQPGHLYHFEWAFLGRHFRGDIGPEALASWFMVMGTVGVIVGAAMARPLSTHLALAVSFLRGYGGLFRVGDGTPRHGVGVFDRLVLTEVGVGGGEFALSLADWLHRVQGQRDAAFARTIRNSLHDEPLSRCGGLLIGGRSAVLQAG